MRHPIHRTTCALTLALLLTPLIGCAAASSPTKTSAPPSPATSASPEVGNETVAPTTFPAAPSDVSGMRDWFAQAYPKAPWLGRIKDIKYVPGEVPDSGGFANAIVITTDLDFGAEQTIGQEIATALGEAHPEWAKQFVVWFADGNNLLAGDIFDATP